MFYKNDSFIAARVPGSSAVNLLTMLLPVPLERLPIEFGLLGFSFIVAKVCCLMTYWVVDIDGASPIFVGETIEAVTCCVLNSFELDLALLIDEVLGVPDDALENADCVPALSAVRAVS